MSDLPDETSWELVRQELLRLRKRVAAIEEVLEQQVHPESDTTDLSTEWGELEVVSSTDLVAKSEQKVSTSSDAAPQISLSPSAGELEAAVAGKSKRPSTEPLFQLASGESWESVVGGRWLTWLGTASLILAVAFFVPWAWRHFAWPAWFRVLMFHTGGLTVLAASWWLSRKDLPTLARGVAGLGIFTLYAAAFAMHHHYHLFGEMSSTATFVDCVAITALTITIALRTNSVAVVLLGALGGYLTPIIASSGSDNYVAMFVYLAFLNVALITCSVLRPWQFLKPIAVMATAFMFVVWIENPQRDETTLWNTQWLIVLHAVIMLVGITLPTIRWRQTTVGEDLLALAGNSLWLVGATWLQFHDRPDQQLAAVCWGMSVLHAALFYWTLKLITNADRMPRVHLALATLFFTLALPLQLRDSLEYLAYAWALEGLAFTAIGVYFRDRQMVRSGTIVLGLALFRAVGIDFLAKPELLGNTSLDRRMVVMVFTGTIMMITGSCYWWVRRIAPPRETAPLERKDGGILIGIGNLVAMLGLICQWDSRLVLLLWTLDAALVWFASLRAKLPAAHAYAILLSIVMVGGRVLYHGDSFNPPFTLLLNERFGSLALVAALYFCAGRYLRLGLKVDAQQTFDVERNSEPLLHFLGNAVLLGAISMEIHNWYNPITNWNSRFSMAEQVTYSVVWAVYAGALVGAGFLLKYHLPRIMGLLGLLAVALKVFFIDLANLSLIFRVLALAALGGMLLVTSFWYQKFTTHIDADG